MTDDEREKLLAIVRELSIIGEKLENDFRHAIEEYRRIGSQTPPQFVVSLLKEKVLRRR